MATPDEQDAAMIARLPEQTGRSLDEWKRELESLRATAHGQIVAALKERYGVTHGYANLIAHKYLRSDAASASDEELVDAQYAGSKSAMKPIYRVIVREVRRFGSDVVLAPKKQYVSLRRTKQFALVQPSASRVDVGISLKGRGPEGRLEAAGGWNAMVTHRVKVKAAEDVDAELIGWLREAYDRA